MILSSQMYGMFGYGKFSMENTFKTTKKTADVCGDDKMECME